MRPMRQTDTVAQAGSGGRSRPLLLRPVPKEALGGTTATPEEHQVRLLQQAVPATEENLQVLREDVPGPGAEREAQGSERERQAERGLRSLDTRAARRTWRADQDRLERIRRRILGAA